MSRRYALVVTSHRGDLYLPTTLGIAREMLPYYGLAQRVIVDDSGSPYPSDTSFEWVCHEHREGLAASVSDAWAAIDDDITHVFHLEEDFHLTQPVDLDAMADVIDRDGLAQMVLLRQPWSPEEQRAGGYLHLYADDYEQRDEYLFTRRLFSLNPCLIPAEVVRGGGGLEAALGERWRERGFGVWGQRDDPPRCLHVGSEGGMGSPGWVA